MQHSRGCGELGEHIEVPRQVGLSQTISLSSLKLLPTVCVGWLWFRQGSPCQAVRISLGLTEVGRVSGSGTTWSRPLPRLVEGGRQDPPHHAAGYTAAAGGVADRGAGRCVRPKDW